MSSGLDLIDYYHDTHAKRIYGTSSVKHIRYVQPWVQIRRPQSLLDYGCGQSTFLDLLDLPSTVERLRYDPALPAYATLPERPVDLLVNIDVLEHVEEADLDSTLAQMRSLCRDAIIVIDTKAAKHVLPDGRNAHVTIRPHAWWHQTLGRHFAHVEPITTLRRSRAGFKTWRSSPLERVRYRVLYTRETLRHLAARLVGRHKVHWKVSSLRRRTSV